MDLIFLFSQSLMTVNKYDIRLGINNADKVLQIPVMLDWELLNTENEVDKLEAQINQDIAGLGIDFDGLVSKENTGNAIYQDPIVAAQEQVKQLREKNHALKRIHAFSKTIAPSMRGLFTLRR